MRKSVVLLLVGCLMVSICGCQKTPEEPIVINKNDGKLEEAVMASASPVSEESEMDFAENYAGIEWKEDFSFKNIMFQVDLKTEARENSAYPVYQIEQGKFTAAEVENFRKLILPDAIGVRERWSTREELYTQLMGVQRGSYTVQDDKVSWEPYEGQEEEIRQLEEEIRQTPETEDFREISPIENLPVDFVYSMKDGTRRYFTAGENVVRYTRYNMKFHVLQPESWVMDGAAPGEAPGTILEHVTIEESAAIEEALEFLEKLGVEGFEVANSQKARILEHHTFDTKTEGWDICFLRTMNVGIPFYLEDSQNSALIDFGEDYAEGWQQESIHILVDEDGIQYFKWTNPVSVEKTLNEDVELLPFSEVQERIKKTFQYGREAATFMNGADWTMDVTIQRIVLSYMPVPIQNDLEHQMLMPVWVVAFEEEFSDGMHYVFALNAVDGSTVKVPL